MRATNTLENVIGLVHEMSTDNYDEFMPVRDMSFESLDHMMISGQPVGVLPSACWQTVCVCPIPIWHAAQRNYRLKISITGSNRNANSARHSFAALPAIN